MRAMPRTPRSLLLTLLAALAALLATSCTDDGDGGDGQQGPPPGAQLLTDSAAAMREVTSTRFELDAEGDIGLPITAAQGQLTNEGSAQGTATTMQLGQNIELDFTVVDETVYLQGLTGGVQQFPTGAGGVIYDPSVILDPDRGIANVLANGREARTEGTEQVNGVETYRVSALFPGDSLSQVVPGYGDTRGRVWISTEDNRLIQARFPNDTGTATVRLSDFNAPVEITPPA